jgi:AcrR family transcriptional regulator
MLESRLTMCHCARTTMHTNTTDERDGAADGRIRRGERSREAIVAALCELIESGVLQPTVQQIADRAGVAIRSVFRHFADTDALYVAMEGRLVEEALRLFGAAEREGDLAERVTGLVRLRASLFEKVGPYKRAANVQRWRSAFMQARHERMQRTLRTDLMLWLPELRGAAPDLIEAVDLATCFESWDRLRADRQVSLKVATAAVTRTVLALVAGEPQRLRARR